MDFLLDVSRKNPEYGKLQKAIEHNTQPVCATGLTGIHKAHLIHSLCTNRGVKAFVVVSNETEGQTLCSDLAAMGSPAYFYPLRDFTFRNVDVKSREYEHQRLNILSKALLGECKVIVACIDAATQYTIPPEVLSTADMTVQTGSEISMKKIIEALTLIGYERCEQVEGSGQFAVRGGILDFFAADAETPVRVEFWGDTIDSINSFDPITQRRINTVEEFSITPVTEVLVKDKLALADKIEAKIKQLGEKTSTTAKEILQNEADALKNGVSLGSIDKFISLVYEKPATLFDYLPKDAMIFVSEHAKTKERFRSYNWQFEEDLKDYFADGVLCKGFETFNLSYPFVLEELEKHKTVFLDTFTHGNFDLTVKEIVSFSAKQLSVWGGSFQVLSEDLDTVFNAKTSCVILAGTEKSAENLHKSLIEKGYPAQLNKSIKELTPGIIYVQSGNLSAGFEYPNVNFILITHGHQNIVKQKKIKAPKLGKQIYSLSELSFGDYVVHSTHGIGIFSGIHKIEMQGITKDYIKVEYAKKDALYVPVTQLDLVSKYIGPKENATVKLSKLGGVEWQNTKKRVKSAVKELARELIVLYSQRMQAEGHAFSPDTEWQHDFENRFEFEETSDQIRCIDEIKYDMERKAPMDRLLCGDVGFGKTEVALRAAFKCVSDSKQCAFLCPTTILAWQHYQTILRRFENFPVRIELLSRFRTAKQQSDIIKRLKHGEIDIIIGTHRLVQKDVTFHDLGLAIIDEEQRFGVAQKERFKELCKNVDVLTLSATPIPRTLNMAMSGIRDMSVLEEAPQDRHPVQTYVLGHDDGVINEAIRRELRRGGQVFYLYNRVDTIDRKAAKITEQIPEAIAGIGHGKMSEHELSAVWQKMLEQEINVLICTTIIETGVDLPNANTLIIENADYMGLSQLHQIRGRVGRSSRRAFAYLTFNQNKVLSEISQKRLTAIREFTEFGSGFKIAMRDLELRGAGNILGAQQHGHMEDVGYDMYLKLLGEAVSEEKGEKSAQSELECLIDLQLEAHIPEDYIESLSGRLDIYRRIADIRSKEDALDVTDELIDRYGDHPSSVMGLIDVALIRNIAASMGIYEVKQNESSILLYLKSIQSEAVPEIIGKMRGRALLNAGNKPYVSVKIEKSTPPLLALREILQ
ncbi:MAG: transcription-repair coupling factor [Bacillota bacterium]|nr:transcription-repair coupling factor [Bacillota bacterium]